MSEIPSTPSDGNVLVLLVPAIADTSAPTVTELTAAGVVDISCYLTGDGLNLTSDQATITDERLCSTQTFEKPGRKTNTAEVTYIDNTNSPHETGSNEAADTLVEGSNHHIVTRRGVPYGDVVAAGQKVSVWPVQAGMPREVAPEANSVIRSIQKLFVTGNVHQKVAVAAATAPPPAWTASTAYAVGDRVTLSGGAVLEATVAGTSGTVAPTAPATVGGTVTDGTVTWKRIS